MVNFIYPVHTRILASDAERSKILELELQLENDEEKGGNYDGEMFDENSKMKSSSIEMTSQLARLGVIIDRMEHLQGLMDLLSCFIPLTTDSKLSVTGNKHLTSLHFVSVGVI